MNKRYLIICNTNYQIINALQLKLTLLRNDDVKIWITDHIKNSKQICQNISEMFLFSDCKRFETYHIATETHLVKKLYQTINLGLGKTNLKLDEVDEVITYNFDVAYFNLVNAIEKNNKSCVWSKMDEGIFSYNTDFYLDGMRGKIIQKLRKLRGYKNLFESFENFYSIYPIIKKIHPEWKNKKIPIGKEYIEELKKYLIKVYGENRVEIKEKVVFFASSSDIDGHSYGETELILKLVKMIGKDNFIVKTHPRDTREIFNDYGIKVMQKSDIPWEVLQIINDYENKFYISVTSGAFISVESWIASKNRCFLLYPEVKIFDDEYQNYVKRMDDVLNLLRENHIGGNIEKCNLAELEVYLMKMEK